jgi:hypothetical protein
LPLTPDLLAGLSPPRRRRPWWPVISGREVWHLVVVGLLWFFFSPANKQAAAGSRFGSIPLSILLFHGHGYGLEDWRTIRGRSHAGTPWPSPWQGDASAAFAPTVTPPLLFCNKSATVPKDSPLYDVDLGSESMHQAAGFLGASQQGTCDGLRRLASASYGRMAALQSHAMASLTSRPSCHDEGSSSFGAASGSGSVPSGHVPGGGAAGRALKSLVGDSKRWTRLHLL